MPKTTKEVRLSPIGLAIYPHLSRPTRDMKDEKDVWEVHLELDPNFRKVKDFLNSLYSETKAKYPKGNPPYKKQLDRDTGEETGMILVIFKSFFPPKLFDIYGQKIDENIIIGMGSEIQVAFITNFYDVAGTKGMNLYLQSVQVRKLIEYKGMEAKDYGFNVEVKEEKPFEDIEDMEKATDKDKRTPSVDEEQEDTEEKLPWEKTKKKTDDIEAAEDEIPF